jgi:hypothetical protein
VIPTSDVAGGGPLRGGSELLSWLGSAVAVMQLEQADADCQAGAHRLECVSEFDQPVGGHTDVSAGELVG